MKREKEQGGGGVSLISLGGQVLHEMFDRCYYNGTLLWAPWGYEHSLVIPGIFVIHVSG